MRGKVVFGFQEERETAPLLHYSLRPLLSSVKPRDTFRVFRGENSPCRRSREAAAVVYVILRAGIETAKESVHCFQFLAKANIKLIVHG